MFRYTRKTFAREIVLILVAIGFLVPFYFLINLSLKNSSDALTTPAAQPATNPTLESFVAAWQGGRQATLLDGLINSTIITGASVTLLVLLASVSAYTLTRRTGKLSRAALGLILVTMVLPMQASVVPLYIGMRNLDLVGTHLGAIILYVGTLLPISIFLYLGFTGSLARDYEEAAQIDGASRLRVFWTIVFPLLSPATGTVAIFTGLIVWNDFFTGLIFLNGSDAVTLPVVIYNFVGESVSQWNVIFAAIIISMLPILGFFLVAQKKFIQGFTGGVKS
jgi:raffinose/stachyose/melibiose transport system permease protein